MLRLLSLKARLIIMAVAAVLVILVVAIVAVAFVIIGSQSASAAPCNPVNPGVPAPSGQREEQLANAKIIDQTAAKLGLSGQASRVAIIAAMGESSLINIDYDDDATNPDGSTADGGGLFQQQPSQGWGTWEQIMDPEYATTSFLIGAKHDRTGGLVSVDGWESMEPTLAIHAVQINADAQHYARYYAQADEIIAAAGIDVSRPGSGGGTDQPGGSGCNVTPVGQAAYPLDTPYNKTSDYGPREINVPGASTWHPADDYQNWPACGKPFYAMLPGTVTLSDRLWLSVTSPEGYVISYLHSYKSERAVNVGDTVEAGQQLGLVGNEGPSGGCHVDVRINVAQNTNPSVAQLPRGDASAGAGNYVNPVEFFALFNLDVCPQEWCRDFSKE
ncbi:putative peptidase [Microbacterium hydrocarbonoxydans]|uniref:Putative peptidase n=1 Tax=Microbacterium hydrocarbonoxydans TaxID=273678 RepID=A0A0M2HYQ8_9MICO|nr:M23 family metallopeptidase [Microbacterium hydrocarbonoxydans]KJL49554.1 putative peptidase [Microbacterium hydrocarbonoxydans]